MLRIDAALDREVAATLSTPHVSRAQAVRPLKFIPQADLTLRDDLRFHDHEPVRARDVVVSLRAGRRQPPIGLAR